MARAITGLSARREQQIQERQMLRLARRFESRATREIRSTMRKLVGVSVGEQAAIMLEHRKALEKILATEWQAAFKWFGNRVLDAAQKQRRGMETKDEVPTTEEFDRLIQEWVRRYGAEKVTQIAGTTQEQAMRIINDTIAQGVAAGMSERELGKMLEKAMREQSAVLSRWRSRVIARTEVHGAANAANQAAAKASGIPMRKEWVASGGERTRSAHAAADGQIVAQDAAFTVDGEQLMYPGDPNGSAGNIINCRCASVMVVD